MRSPATLDFNFTATDEGWLYLASEMHLYSRRIVGWAMFVRITTELTTADLSMATWRRRPPAGLLHHSDRGSQYANSAFRRLLSAHKLVCGRSRRGNASDNAPMESSFGTLKQKRIHHTCYTTRDQARTNVFEYIEAFYNRRRLHSALGYKSPAEFEADSGFS